MIESRFKYILFVCYLTVFFLYMFAKYNKYFIHNMDVDTLNTEYILCNIFTYITIIMLFICTMF